MLSGKANTSAPTKLRQTVKGKQLKFFDAQGVDELVSISLQLAQELWVVKERLATLEAAAAKKGVILADEVEGLAFTPEQRATLDAERKIFIDRIFFTLREQADALDYVLPEGERGPRLR